jgi:hypothetical protein
MPVGAKIFLLPKIATQSPRNALLAAINQVRRHHVRIDREMRELRKHLRHSRFLRS